MYNADLIKPSKRTHTYVFSAFKCKKRIYEQHLKMNTSEYWNHGIRFIIIVVFSFHINGLMFSIALLNCLPVYCIFCWSGEGKGVN